MRHATAILILLPIIAASCTTQMTLREARAIAEDSECANLTDEASYNENSRTWWIGMDVAKEGCAPACVVWPNGTAEVNWRCTGLLS